MKADRSGRLATLIKEEISRILLMEMQDEEFRYVSVTRVDLARDLSNAKVFVSTFVDSEGQEKHEALIKKLILCRGFLRKELSRHLSLRHTPKLSFVYDDSLEHAQKISDLIDGMGRGSV